VEEFQVARPGGSWAAARGQQGVAKCYEVSMLALDERQLQSQRISAHEFLECNLFETASLLAIPRTIQIESDLSATEDTGAPR
jgi:hypothetical protein